MAMRSPHEYPRECCERCSHHTDLGAELRVVRGPENFTSQVVCVDSSACNQRVKQSEYERRQLETRDTIFRGGLSSKKGVTYHAVANNLMDERNALGVDKTSERHQIESLALQYMMLAKLDDLDESISRLRGR